MITFAPLKGIEHSKAYLKDKSYRGLYKQFVNNNYEKWISELSAVQTCVISNNSTMFYIMSPSLYKSNCIQLTTFIRNLPYSHHTYDTLEELIKENHMHFYFDEYKISEQ